MFDAAHAVRHDMTSQGGFLAMLTPAAAFEGKETSYHVLDWKNFKLPRVARSSLLAEAQAGSQVADAAEFICRFWTRMLRPDLPLREIFQQKSELRPTLITDAKALFDSFHRDGYSSVTDKRTALEVLVLKEQMLALGGGMKWISLERQFADSLTKMSSRQLLGDRLRHGRIKFTWDPTFTASKKKDKGARLLSREEFTNLQGRENPPEAEAEVPKEMEAERPTARVVESLAWSRNTMVALVMFAQLGAMTAEPAESSLVIYDMMNTTVANAALLELTWPRSMSVLGVLLCALLILAIFCFWFGYFWKKRIFQKMLGELQ